MSDTNNTVIVGGGWAGLSAAIELSRQHHPVQVLESARQLGGRARRVAFNTDTVDNGQHLLIAAYRDTLKLFKLIGLDIDTALQRYNLDWQVSSPTDKTIHLQAYTAPAPLHLFLGLIMARGLNWRDKVRVLQLGHSLWKKDSLGSEDISVKQWLAKHRQTKNLIESFWEPLCLATLNTPLEEASAKYFIRILNEAFLHSASASQYLIPTQDLSGSFVDPAMNYIEQHGGTITLAHRVEQLLVENNQIVGVQCQDKRISATNIILTTPPHITAKLLDPVPGTDALCEDLNHFSYHPICTIYLRYPKTTQLPTSTPLLGLRHTLSQWIFDRRISQQPGIMAVVISSEGPHMDIDNDELVQRVAAELAECFPHWPVHEDAMVIREKRATFACHTGIDSIRPQSATPVNGLYLAGDYTDTGYPATLEGAVQSGLMAARAILKTTRMKT